MKQIKAKRTYTNKNKKQQKYLSRAKFFAGILAAKD
jgi:hypothetical protein